MLRHKETGTVLARNLVYAKNIFKQGTGLMFRRKLQDTAWIFPWKMNLRPDITNLFVFQTIDIAWLNHDGVVIQKKTVRPFELHVRGPKNCASFIELPEGALKKVKRGDSLVW